MNQQYQDHNMAYGRPGDGDQVMYAPFAQYDAPPPPPQSQGLQYQSYYPMNEPMDPNHPSEMQFSAPAPTRLRARRAPGERGSLEVAVHPYNMDGRPLSPNRYSPGIPPMPPLPPKSSLRGKTAEEEEARKARKREMGRERQRRKRMRDKAKREAMEGQGSSTSTLLGRPAGDRSSFASVSSYEGPSSVSTSYSNLPPMSVTISSPSHSFGMSSSGSMSDMSSPGHLSPTMAGFASDDSSWEHNTMLSTLSLSGGGDATVRASKPRAQSAALSSIAGSRRDSGAEVPGNYAPLPSPSKRRKSDTADQRMEQVGLGVNFGADGGAGDGAWRHTRALRRTESVPDNIPIDPALTGEPHRSPTPPPGSLGHGSGMQGGRPRPSADGNYFASTVVLALSQSQWSGEIHNRLGLERSDLDSMGPGLAVAYDRWRMEQSMERVSLDSGVAASPPPSSPARPFATPSSRGGPGQDTSASPSTSSNNSHQSMPSLTHRPGSNPAMGVASAGRPPETPNSKQNGGSGSSSTSPAHPTLQTPSSNSQAVFPHHDINQTWTAATARMYEVGWRDQYPSQPIPGQMPTDGSNKPGMIPPPPLHAPSNAPMPALQSPVTMQPGVFQTPTQAAPRTFAPQVHPQPPHPQRGMPGAPMYYGSPMGVPQGVNNNSNVSLQHGDEMLQLGQ